jgi:replicative DNA helicase
LKMEAGAPFIAVEIEQALLGAILHDPNVLDRIDGQLVADDFGEQLHRRLFEGFAEAHQAGRHIDLRLAIASLGPDAATQLTTEVTAAQYVARLASEAIGTQNAKTYAHSIRQAADKRRLLDVADRIKASATSARSAGDLAEEAIEDLDAIVSMQTASHLAAVDVGAAAERLVESMTVRMQNPGALTGISTGLPDLDAKTGGYHRGELTIVAGRPGMGKSAFGVSSSRQSAAQVHYFSLEMTAEALTARALTDAIFDHRDPVAYFDVISGRVSVEQAQRVVDAQREFSLPIKIDAQAGLSVQQITARARKHQQSLRRKGADLDLVVVDHLHLVRASDRYRGNKVAEVTEVSAGLKALAKDLNVAVVALAQLNRAVESRDDKRPNLSDLRESGSIEQDADLVLLLYREAHYLGRPCSNPKDDDARLARLFEVRNKLEVEIGKARNGPTGIVPLFFDVAANAIRNWSRAA